jgi:flagellar protein FlaG
MAANVDKIASVALSLNQSPKQQTDTQPKEKAAPTPDAPNASDYRLVIEEDKAAGTFVYKTIDRSTGEVVSQFPREELLKLRENPAYTAGSVL